MIATKPQRPMPTDVPIIIFSGVYMKSYVPPLQIAGVEAVMTSFEYVRGNPKKFHENVMPLLNWGARTYLDSGIFSLMRRMGVSRARIHGASTGVADPMAAFKSLAKDYARYLEQYGDQWDHIVELDVDQVLGPHLTLATRSILRRIVGDRLMPVWHDAAGEGAWETLVREFPYIAIGGDAGTVVAGSRSDVYRSVYRDMVRYAHANGVLVHGMGDTKAETFRQVGWDSGDSTTWVNGQRFGKYGRTRYSEYGKSSEGAKASQSLRAFENWLIEHHLDPELVARKGQNNHKLLVNIYLLQAREQQLRRERKFGQQILESVSEDSGISFD